MGMVVDLHEQLRLGEAAEDGDFRLTTPGAYVLVLQTDDRAQTRCGFAGAGQHACRSTAGNRARSKSVRCTEIRELAGPLAGALVKLTDLNNDATPFAVHVTDHDGRANFTMPNAGSWLLNVIWTKVLPRSEETDFETVFSSLSFGFPPYRR